MSFATSLPDRAAMLELTCDNTLTYLRTRGFIGPEEAHVEPLGGGVSNVVLRVTTAGRTFVLKQSRPRLRTREDWFSDLDRVYREQEVMHLLQPLLQPLTVPQVLFVDRDNYLFAMSQAPAGARSWKEDLLAGAADQSVAERAGVVLGKMHQATAESQEARSFVNQTVFIQLRVDPFYRRVQERRPEVAAAIAGLIDQMLSRKEALCHGDYTPKNMLVHSAGFMLVDYETAYFGDPAMDLGLFLCHLLLKAFKNPARRQNYFALTRAFWGRYDQEVRFQPAADLKARGIGHCAACLLARVDGTSPIDYLPEEFKREAVRRLARRMLHEPIQHWPEVLEACDAELVTWA
jgi:5-methylthioribose kinase